MLPPMARLQLLQPPMARLQLLQPLSTSQGGHSSTHPANHLTTTGTQYTHKLLMMVCGCVCGGGEEEQYVGTVLRSDIFAIQTLHHYTLYHQFASPLGVGIARDRHLYNVMGPLS